jgi:hypothetical protein
VTADTGSDAPAALGMAAPAAIASISAKAPTWCARSPSDKGTMLRPSALSSPTWRRPAHEYVATLNVSRP